MSTPTEDIKSRIDIIDLIREYVPLTQAGANWRARCPFHNEKTPSFMVSQLKQVWHCFGCTEGGDHFTFVMKIENLEFREALELLAKKAGVELPHTLVRGPSFDQKERVRLVLKSAQQWFSEQLKNSAGSAALAYLNDQRRLTDDAINIFSIGYAPSSWDALSRALVINGHALADVIASGLVIERQSGSSDSNSQRLPFYDRFRNRIMFPIRDFRGELVGFGGRILELANSSPLTVRGAIVEEAKYLNTPQTVLYDKRSVLYNADRSRTAIRNQQSAIILEGYMDVIASMQAGVEHVVATCGTALTAEHLRLLKRLTERVILSFDSDAAGMKASQRGIELLLGSGLAIGMIRIPAGKGKDADECIRLDPSIWKHLAQEFRPFLEVLWEELTAGAPVTSLAQQERIQKEFLPYIARLDRPVERAYWVKTVSDAFGYPQQTVEGWIVFPQTPKRASKIITPTLDIDQAFIGLLLLDQGAVDKSLFVSLEPSMLDREECREWFSDWLKAEASSTAQSPPVENRPPAAWFTHIVTTAEFLFGDLESQAKARELKRLALAIRARFLSRELARIQEQLRQVEHGGTSATSAAQTVESLLKRAQEINRELHARSLS